MLSNRQEVERVSDKITIELIKLLMRFGHCVKTTNADVQVAQRGIIKEVAILDPDQSLPKGIHQIDGVTPKSPEVVQRDMLLCGWKKCINKEGE